MATVWIAFLGHSDSMYESEVMGVFRTKADAVDCVMWRLSGLATLDELACHKTELDSEGSTLGLDDYSVTFHDIQ